MPELPKKKVGIIACSGEELAEGTITRLAALKVLEQLRPAETVTICLPLFLAGGEGDRAFARFYPTIALDGCDKRCAARATELYSNRPAASLVVTDLAPGALGSARRLNDAGRQAVDVLADRVATQVDEWLDRRWSRRAGTFDEKTPAQAVEAEPTEAPCACGSGIPVGKLVIAGQEVALVALPLIFEQFRAAGQAPSEATLREMLDTVKIYNPVPPEAEGAYAQAVLQAYVAFCEQVSA